MSGRWIKVEQNGKKQAVQVKRRKPYGIERPLALEESARKDTNRIKFNLTPLEKIVLSLVGENKDTSRAIHDELILQEYNTTQRSVENALESLRRKKLLDREILKGREYRYFLIDKI